MLYSTLLHLTSITLTARNDLEQLNSFDKIVLREDDSSFTTIPSSLPERKPLSKYDEHARNTYNSGPPYFYKRHHGHHHSDHHSDHDDEHHDGNHHDHHEEHHSHCPFSNHSHLHKSHKKHKKNSYGNHAFHTHYTNHSNVTPDNDMYVPYDSMHYPRFPSKYPGDDKNEEEEEESDPDDINNDDDKLALFAAFH